MPASANKKNPVQWLITYVREAKGELNKVTWPSKKETVKYSLIVIALSVLLAAFFAGLDWVLDQALAWLISFTT